MTKPTHTLQRHGHEAAKPDPSGQMRREERARAAERAPQTWRPDSDGWHRFRGQPRRGVPPAAEIDAVDLNHAITELVGGRAALLEAHRIGPAKERRAAIRAALGKLALASRFCDAVVERRGGTPGDVGDQP
jgi:hypothetical protein